MAKRVDALADEAEWENRANVQAHQERREELWIKVATAMAGVVLPGMTIDHPAAWADKAVTRFDAFFGGGS